MLLLGVTYMFAASTLWPGIPLVVPRELIGTANGIATSIQMIGIALANMAVGALQDANPGLYPGTKVHKYDYCIMFFAAMGVVAAGFSLLLNVIDSRCGGQLNAVPGREDPGRLTEPAREMRGMADGKGLDVGIRSEGTNGAGRVGRV